MLKIKREIIDIVLLDKKYKNLEKGIDKLIVEVYDYYKKSTDSKELPIMYFYLLNEELEKINILFPKYDENLVLTILQIFIVIDEMKIICENMEKKRAKNYDLKLLEHDINNVEKQINMLKHQLEQAIILNNDNDIFKFNFAIEMYRDFKENKTDALANYKLAFEGAFFLLYADSSIKEKLNSFSKLQGYETNEKLNEKFLLNVDYFYDIYCLINGYLLSSKKIYKSSALKIFNIANDNLKLNKTDLIGKVLYLFEKLGIDNINLDLKKVHNIRKISIYHNYIVYDYSTNTKDSSLYLTMFEIAYKIVNGTMERLEEHNFNNPDEELKKYLYLCALEVFTDNYNKLKYII